MKNFTISFRHVGGAWAALIVMVSIAAFIGCATIGTSLLQKPKVALDKVNVRDLTGTGATLLFGVRVTNPNPVALKVDAVKYEIELAGKPFSRGSIDKATEVQANSDSVVEIPVAVRYSDLFSSLAGFLGQGSSTYRIKGDATFGILSVPFDHAGELKLKK